MEDAVSPGRRRSIVEDPASPGGRRPNINAGFIAAETDQPAENHYLEGGPWHKLRVALGQILQMTITDCAFGVITAIDITCTVYDIDSRAAGAGADVVLEAISGLCSLFYLVEFCARWFVFGRQILLQFWTILDIFVMFAAALDIIIQAAGAQIDIGMLRCIRVARVLRLLRVVKRFRWLAELKKLVQMCAACTKTLFWSLVFAFGVTTLWSMLAVEFVNPLMENMIESGAFADCLQCQRSMNSVMRTNLLTFQTVIAGDSWGQIAVPMIEAYPLTAIIFMGAQLTLVFGVLNLLVAVVVDSAAEQRAKDIATIAEDMDIDHQDDIRFLHDMFRKVDKDHNGKIDLQELVQGAKVVPEFRNRLRVMDIDQHDLEQLFIMLDDDNDGDIDATEFIKALSRWVFASKTADRFVKYNLMRSMQDDSLFYNFATRKFDEIEQAVLEIKSRMANVSSGCGEEDSKAEPLIHDATAEKCLSTLHGPGGLQNGESCRKFSQQSTARPLEILSSEGLLGKTVSAEIKEDLEHASSWVKQALATSVAAAEASLRSSAFSAAERAFRQSVAALLSTDATLAEQAAIRPAQAPEATLDESMAAQPDRLRHDELLWKQEAVALDHSVQCPDQSSHGFVDLNSCLDHNVRV